MNGLSLAFRRPLAGYVFVLAVVLAAIGLQKVLDPVLTGPILHAVAKILPFLLAIAAISWYAGPSLALIALMLVLASARYLSLEILPGLEMKGTGAWIGWALYACAGVIAMVLGNSLRRSHPPDGLLGGTRADSMRRICDNDKPATQSGDVAVSDLEGRSTALIDAVKDYAIFMLDAEGRVASWNTGAELILGFRSHEILGKHYSGLFDVGEQSTNRAQRDLEIAAYHGRCMDENWWVRKNGFRFRASAAINAIQDGDSRIAGFAVVARDISEQWRAEQDRAELIVEYARHRQFLERLIESATAAIAVVEGRQFRFLFANSGFRAATGATDVSILGRTAAEMFPEAFRQGLEEQMREAFEKGRTVRRNEQVLPLGPDKRQGWWNTEFVPLHDDAGQVYALLMLAREVTSEVASRHRIQEMARQAEDQCSQLRAILDAISEGLIIADAQGNVQSMNSVALALLEFQSVDQVRRPVAEFAEFFEVASLDGQEVPKEEWPLARALRGERFSKVELRVRRRTTQKRWIGSFSGTLVRGDDGQIAGAVLTFHDKTAEKQAETALRESEEKLKLALEAAKMGMWDWNLTTGELSCSRRSSALLGVHPGRLGGYDEILAAIHPDDRQRIYDAIMEAVNARICCNVEMRSLQADNAYRWIAVKGRAYYDAAGEPTRVSGVSMDISDRKRAEEELQQAKDSSERANRIKSLFLATISHELRTPMNAILGMTELALEEKLEPVVRDYLQTVKESADVLLALLNEILDFSRIESGRVALESTPFQLRDLIEEAVRSIAVRAYAKGLELACDIPPDVPDHVLGDPLRLRQVLVNLVGNAIKFTERGEVIVRVKVDQAPEQRNPGELQIRFEVMDTGIGIAPEDRERIFTPFAQAESSTSRQFGGTGLGLAIASSLTRMMGGRIWLDSEPGNGTTFFFTVRIAVAPESNQDEETVAGKLRDLPALIVEDHEISRNILERTLQDWSMKPQAVSDGAGAVASLRSAAASGKNAGIVLIDSHLPDMTGSELVEKIRRDPELAKAVRAIVLMLSPGDRHTAKPCAAADVDGCLDKPVLQRRLFRTLLDVLEVETSEEREDDDVANRQPPAQVAERALKILLAEDIPANQKLVLRLLDKRGHVVDMAENGQQAVELVQQHDYDLILMDVQMPVMDGFRATESIRALPDPKKSRLPIVAMTAHAMRGDEERCLSAGMDGYITKPLHSGSLIETVERLARGGMSPNSSR